MIAHVSHATASLFPEPPPVPVQAELVPERDDEVRMPGRRKPDKVFVVGLPYRAFSGRVWLAVDHDRLLTVYPTGQVREAEEDVQDYSVAVDRKGRLLSTQDVIDLWADGLRFRRVIRGLWVRTTDQEHIDTQLSAEFDNVTASSWLGARILAVRSERRGVV